MNCGDIFCTSPHFGDLIYEDDIVADIVPRIFILKAGNDVLFYAVSSSSDIDKSDRVIIVPVKQELISDILAGREPMSRPFGLLNNECLSFLYEIVNVPGGQTTYEFVMSDSVVKLLPDNTMYINGMTDAYKTDVVKKLSMSFDGTWATGFLRELLWYQKKPFTEAINNAMLFLECAQLTAEQRRVLAIDLLIGRKKLVGNTRDKTYTIIEDDYEFLIPRIDWLLSHNKKVDDAVSEQFIDKFCQLLYTTDPELSYLPLSTAFKQLPRFKEALSAFIHANYGFIDRSGQYHPVPWGDHHSFAWTYVEDHNLADTFRKWALDEDSRPDCIQHSEPVDFLVYELGWILMHNTQYGYVHQPTVGRKQPTKSQCDTLFSYYMERNDLANAMKYGVEGD